MSYRSFDEPPEYTQWTKTYSGCNPCTLPVTEHGETVLRIREGRMASKNTPNYWRLVKEGKMLPLNHYDRWDYIASAGNRTASYWWTGSCKGVPCPVTATYSGLTYLNQLYPNPAWDRPNFLGGSPDWDALLIAAQADMLPSLDALTTAIEARKTVDMVLHARRTAKDLIREALKGGKHTAKAAADAWLQWRYGWEQLGRDVKNVYELILNPYQLVVEGRAGVSIPYSTTTIESGAWGPCVTSLTREITADNSYRANCIGILKGETLNALADPAISLWETIPYSFVIDWFVNVGDVLGAWKVRNSLARSYSSIGAKVEVTVLTTEDGFYETSTEGRQTNGNCREVYTSRFRLPGWNPSLVPSFNVNLTSKRIIDAAALLSKRIL